MIDRTAPRFGFALAALALLAVCLHGQSKQHLSESDNTTFYFHGTIGQTLEVEMILTRHDKQTEGSYVYASQRKRIPIKGEMTAPAEYQLDESGPDGAVTGYFKLNELIGLGHLHGTWESPDHKRKLNVFLGPDYFPATSAATKNVGH